VGEWFLGAISSIDINVTVWWSVCLFDMFVHCAQTAEGIDMISFAYDNPMSLPDRVKIWLTSVDPFLHKYCPK